MSYELEIAEEAIDDLHVLVESIPSSRRVDAIEGIKSRLLDLATNPIGIPRLHYGRPTYLFQFVVEGTRYYWGATFCYSHDETSIIITSIFRASAL